MQSHVCEELPLTNMGTCHDPFSDSCKTENGFSALCSTSTYGVEINDRFKILNES